MKKLYSLLVLSLCLLAGVTAQAQTVVFDFTANPWDLPLGSGSGESAAAGNVTEPIVATSAESEAIGVSLTCEQGTAQQPPRMWTGPQLRAYNGNSFTLTPTDSSLAIVSVVFESDGSNFGLNVTEGELNDKVWTGNHTEVTFSPNKTNRLKTITVTLAAVNDQTVKPGANVQMPTISPRNNTSRTDSVVVTITGADGTQIYYTLDGSEPTSASQRYSEAFILFESATVKAVAYDSLGNASAVAEVSYIITPSEDTGGDDVTGTDSTSVDTLGVQYIFKQVTSLSETGQYLIVARDADNLMQVAKPLTSNYGYLKVEQTTLQNDTIITTSLDNVFTIALVSGEESASYTITQPDGRQLYQKGTYNSFNVDAAPSEGQYWSLTLNAEDSLWTILNLNVNKFVQYDTSYGSYGSYEDARGLRPALYLLVDQRGDDSGEGGDEPNPGGGEDDEYTTVTFPFSENPWELETGSTSASDLGGVTEPIVVDNVTFSTDNGGGSTVVRMWVTNGNTTLRTYRGTAITFSVNDETKAIYRLVFEANGMNYTSQVGEVSTSDKTWSGNASEVTLAATATTQVKTVTVYLGERTDETVLPGVYVAAPVISPASGEKADSVEVSIKAGEGSYIYYTIDGTEPTWNSLRYTEPFKLYESATVKAIAYDDEGNPSEISEASYTITITEPEELDDDQLFVEAATNSQNQLIVEDVTLPEDATSAWRFDSRYGAVASGYINKANCEVESWLKLPVLTLPETDELLLYFEQAIGYLTAEQAPTYFQLYVREVSATTATRSLKGVSDEWTLLPLSFPEKADGKNFSDFLTMEVDLAAYKGKSVEIGFHYTSDTEIAGTWELRNIEVTSSKREDATAIQQVSVTPATRSTIYDLQGRRVLNPSRGIYIVDGRKVYVK